MVCFEREELCPKSCTEQGSLAAMVSLEGRAAHGKQDRQQQGICNTMISGGGCLRQKRQIWEKYTEESKET